MPLWWFIAVIVLAAILGSMIGTFAVIAWFNTSKPNRRRKQ